MIPDNEVVQAEGLRRPVAEWAVGGLRVHVHNGSEAAGEAAGEAVLSSLRTLLAEQDSVRVVFAAAPSQLDMLRTVRAAKDVDWSRVVAFHLDEYVGLEHQSPARFGSFLRQHLFDHVRPGTVHVMEPDADPDAEARRYAALLAQAPVDIVCLGIGENGHLAFNDPPVADFDDPELVKLVDLDETCRMQQVNDRCFSTLADVPRRALTVTIRGLLTGHHIVAVVPAGNRAGIVHTALTGPIAEQCPASALRKHPNADLFLSSGAARDVIASAPLG